MEYTRTVKYLRHEFHGDPEPCENTLLTFIYDIPYFSACGLFPPYHIVNQVFSSGGSTGGMGPGATWEPFTISAEEYDRLVTALKDTRIAEIRPYARYAHLQMKIDHELDHMQDRIEWMRAACAKHRDRWHDELKNTKMDEPS